MAKKKYNNYFLMLESLMEISCRAARELERILADFRVERLDEDMKKLHAIEHEADEQKHHLVNELVREFITPIEREDIMAITDQIDDVTDAIEDVLLKIYMFNIQHIQDDAVLFAGIIKKCCDKLLNVFQEFVNFKKPKSLLEAIIELNRLEEQGDALYIKAVRKLYLTQKDARATTVWTEIYNVMETACDTCEHVADLVEHVIMKNS